MRHSLYSHGKNRHFGDPDCSASDAGRGEDMGTGVGADRGTGSAAKARKPDAAPLFRRASALALIGMAAAMITRRRAGWPVRRVSIRSRITRQSPAYAPCDGFADVSAPAPAIASADTARRIRFITASFFHVGCERPSARTGSGYLQELKGSRNFAGTDAIVRRLSVQRSQRISKNLRSKPRASSRRGESSDWRVSSQRSSRRPISRNRRRPS
jgi:hypothetical protein